MFGVSICHVKIFSLGRDTIRLLHLACSLLPYSIPQSNNDPFHFICIIHFESTQTHSSILAKTTSKSPDTHDEAAVKLKCLRAQRSRQEISHVRILTARA